MEKEKKATDRLTRILSQGKSLEIKIKLWKHLLLFQP